jgi:anaerobic selenocysteine-containing dehydrogenase
MKKIVRSVCQGSHCECGVLVHVLDGKIIKIEGDPEHPMNRGYICVKGRAQPQFVHHPDRLKYPMRRVGERGSGKWQRISWDNALDEIAEKLTDIKEKNGPESISTIHGTGPRSSLYSAALLASALGSPNVISVDLHICFVPSLLAEHSTYGNSIMMERGPDYLNSNCIIVVGGNPLVSHPPKGIEILEAKRTRNSKLIVIDPYYTQLAARADLWLQIRPGTDVALALGMIRTIVDEELYDKTFVKKWCHGFEELKKRLEEYPLEKISEITWIPVDKIREAARIYAKTRPAAMHHRVAVEHNINSTQTCRALAILIALTGNIDVKGGNLLSEPIPGHISHAEIRGLGNRFRLPPEIERKRIGAKQYPLIAGPNALAPFVPAPLAHEALRDGKPYAIKAMLCSGGNPVLTMQNSKGIWDSLKSKLDLHVVSEFFMTPTAEIADYVLPSAMWLERDETCDLMYTNFIASRQKVIEPLGECWHDMKISIELVKRIPWANRKFLPWNDVEEFNEELVKEMGISFKQLKKKGYVISPIKYKKYEYSGFNTQSRKVEFFSTIFQKHGYDPLPYFKEPPESPMSTPELFEKYPLILYTGRRHEEFYHSQGRQVPALRERVPDPLVHLHPETAKQVGIEDGDWVFVQTPQMKGEQVRFKAKITTNVHPKMAHATHAWWFPEKPAPEHGCFESNINVITTDEPPREEICASVRTRGTLCRICKSISKHNIAANGKSK